MDQYFKYIQLPNEYLSPNFTGPYHRKQHGLLLCDQENQVFVIKNEEETLQNHYKIDEVFVSHYWNLIQFAQEYFNTFFHTEQKKESSVVVFDLHFHESKLESELKLKNENSNNKRLNNQYPFKVYVNFVLSETFIAHPISYEVWVNPYQFCSLMKTKKIIPHEIYFTELIHRASCLQHGIANTVNLDNYIIPKDLTNNNTTTTTTDNNNNTTTTNNNNTTTTNNNNDIINNNTLTHFLSDYWKYDDYPLFPHQNESLQWMLNLEQEIINKKSIIQINNVSIPILNTGFYYDIKYKLIIPLKRDHQLSIPVYGGILADITGSGKTCTALALILSTLNQDHTVHQSCINPIEPYLYYNSRATMIIVPTHLIYQWTKEINKFIEKEHLKIIIVKNYHDFKKTNLKKLLEADLVLVSESFLSSKRYLYETSQSIKSITGQTDPESLSNQEETMKWLAWRVEISKSKCQQEHKNCVSFSYIKWKRIIVDEIHNTFKEIKSTTTNITTNITSTTRIKNKSKKSFSNRESIINLNACFYWGLSGTPVVENQNMLQNYIQYICHMSSSCWIPGFQQVFYNKCFHRFSNLQLSPIEKHLNLIQLSLREQQLLECYQHDLSLEKQIQLCSYFNLIDEDDKKISLLPIEEIIKKVIHKKKTHIKNIQIKIKNQNLVIDLILSKIKETKKLTLNHEKLLNRSINYPKNKKQKLAPTLTLPNSNFNYNSGSGSGSGSDTNFDVTLETKSQEYMDLQPLDLQELNLQELNLQQMDLQPLDLQELNLQQMNLQQMNLQQIECNDRSLQPIHIREEFDDMENTFKLRKKRLERLVKRKNQYLDLKQKLKKEIGYFESKASHVKQSNALDNCPICFTSKANVITQCGHLFCRVCVLKCLKTKPQCPVCKSSVQLSETHEIQLELNNEDKIQNENINRFGSKCSKLLQVIENIIEKQEKIIVYCMFTPLMNFISKMLHEQNIMNGILKGSIFQQTNILKQFKFNPEYSVLIGSIHNTGLDLVEANHIIFVHAIVGEDYMVRAIEEQAIARIHRQGQSKPVHAHWFITRNTIEEQTFLQTRV